MKAATPRNWGYRIAASALLAAWLLLLGGLGAVVGYVLFLPDPEQSQPASRPLLALELPGPDAGEDEAAALETGETEAGQQAAETTPAQPLEQPQEQTQEQIQEQGQVQTAEAPPVVAAPPLDTGAEGQGEPKPEAPEAADATAPQDQPAPADTQQAAVPPIPLAPIPLPLVVPAWQRNAQPFEVQDDRPRIAVVLTGMGLSSAATEAAIKQLPGPVSLSFTPYSRRLNEWIALARVNGHEVLLDLPMEPTSYPNDDPGPQALLTALSSRQNLERLDWALRRATGFVGVTAVMGSRFLASEEHMTPILTELKDRGFLFLDNRETDTSVAGPLAQKLGMANAVNHRFLDRVQASRVAIDARLVQLERIARSDGFAVAIGQPYPVTIERLREWASQVEARGFVLAPLSAVAAARLAGQSAAGVTQ